MVSTLFAAENFVQKAEDLIISYGDIIYRSEVLDKLFTTEGDLLVSADLD